MYFRLLNDLPTHKTRVGKILNQMIALVPTESAVIVKYKPEHIFSRSTKAEERHLGGP